MICKSFVTHIQLNTVQDNVFNVLPHQFQEF